MCVRFDVLSPNSDQALGEAHRAGDAVEHRDAGLASEVAGEVGHAGAAEHDRLGPVLGEGALDLPLDRDPGARAWLLEREHRNFGGAHPGAAREEPVFGRGCARSE